MDSGDGGPPPRPSGDPRCVRRRVGGRPKASERQPGLKLAYAHVLAANSAVSPTDLGVVWTDLKPMQLAADLMRRGFAVGGNTGARLLGEAGYWRRALGKAPITGRVEPLARDGQFRHIDVLCCQAHAAGNPVLRVDTKRNELLGYLHRPGQCSGTDVQRVYDHVFRHLAAGLLITRSVYDKFNQRGFMIFGTSRETCASVCDAIALAWAESFRHDYQLATEIVLTFDAGGANAARSLRFKEDLIAQSARLGLALRIAHYPPYTSKWHPIEHRLFSQVERALRGVMLDTVQTALATLQRVSTQTGLTVMAMVLD